MQKPVELRAFMTAAIETFRTSPEKLQVFVGKGHLVSTGTASLSYEYRYTLTLFATDFNGEPEALMVPLLVWLRRNQPEIFDNTTQRKDAIRFEADILNHDTVDVEIEVDMTERVRVTKGVDGRLTVEYVPEPLNPDMPTEDSITEVWAGDQKLAELPMQKWNSEL
jgi:hypothetical protein